MREIKTTTFDGEGAIMSSTSIASTEGNSSIEITTDAKGNIKPTVKVYNDDPYLAMDKALELWNYLKDKFGDSMLGSKTVEGE